VTYRIFGKNLVPALNGFLVLFSAAFALDNDLTLNGFPKSLYVDIRYAAHLHEIAKCDVDTDGSLDSKERRQRGIMGSNL
jgi:hypothetical protein